MTNNVYLNTAFAFMACDGEIVPEEIATIRAMGDNGLFPIDNFDQDLETLISELNKQGKHLIKRYLDSLCAETFTRDESLKVLQVAVETIYADNDVAYSEVKFFRAVRRNLPAIDDEDILANIPEVDDFWLASDIKSANVEKEYFDSIEMPQFDLAQITG